MKLAYFVNTYPKTSHSFIRREILALERQGHDVLRISGSRVKEPLPEAEDRAEAEKTRFVIDAGYFGLLRALLATAATRPSRFVRALGRALATGPGSERGLVMNVAYLAEACLILPWVRDFGAEHLHAHFGTGSASVAMFCRILGGPRYSFTVHGPEEFDRPERLGLTEKMERAALVFGVSSFGRSQLLRWVAPEHWPKVQIVRCGLDPAFLGAPHVPVPDRPRLVTVGRLAEQKGHLLLVEAAARLKAEGLSFELVLVGDGALRPAIEAAARKFGLEDTLSITGWADAERVRAELLAARALVLPSFAEGLPVVLMESLALGRPVISTYVAGIPELVEDGTSGWLVPAGDVDALAEAMRRALTASRGELERLAEAGRSRVLEHHDAEVSARTLIEHLEALDAANQ